MPSYLLFHLLLYMSYLANKCRICEVISDKNGALMKRPLRKKCTNFGEKIVRSYWVITFLVLGHFLKPHPVYHAFDANLYLQVNSNNKNNININNNNNNNNVESVLTWASIFRAQKLVAVCTIQCNWQRSQTRWWHVLPGTVNRAQA